MTGNTMQAIYSAVVSQAERAGRQLAQLETLKSTEQP